MTVLVVLHIECAKPKGSGYFGVRLSFRYQSRVHI